MFPELLIFKDAATSGNKTKSHHAQAMPAASIPTTAAPVQERNQLLGKMPPSICMIPVAAVSLPAGKASATNNHYKTPQQPDHEGCKVSVDKKHTTDGYGGEEAMDGQEWKDIGEAIRQSWDTLALENEQKAFDSETRMGATGARASAPGKCVE